MEVADGVGFEPTVGVNPRRFSRPVPSTARPPVRLARTRILGSACFHNKREWQGSLAQAGEGDDRDGQVVGPPVGTASEALRIIDEQPLDGVLPDLKLHGEVGVTVARRLRCKGVPFVVVTAYAADAVDPELRHDF